MSRIRANTITNKTATGAPTFSNGAVVSGVCTATTFSGSGASLTSLPAGNLTGTLPAISGANLTGISAGITEADSWRVTADFDRQTVAVLSSNWARTAFSSGTLAGYKGTGMTESSGIFTFPSTGIWLILAHMNYHARYGVASSVDLYLDGTQDNSNYVTLVNSFDCAVWQSGYYEWGHMNISAIVDITNTSTHKVRFQCGTSNNQVKFYSGSGGRLNQFNFIRIGDT